MTKVPQQMTVSAQAKALNLSPRRVSQLRSEGMPHSLAESRAWRRERADVPADYHEARTRKMRAAAQLAELQLDRERGDVISRAEFKESDFKLAAAMQAYLRRLENELPQLVLGLSLERSRPITKKFVREMQDALADEKSAFWAAHPSADDK